MATSSFRSFADASEFAKRMAKERRCSFRIVRREDAFDVEESIQPVTLSNAGQETEPATEQTPLANRSHPGKDDIPATAISEARTMQRFVPYLDGRENLTASPPDSAAPEPTNLKDNFRDEVEALVSELQTTRIKATKPRKSEDRLRNEVEALRKKLQATSIKSRKPTPKSQIGAYSGGWASPKQGVTKVGDAVSRSYVDEGISGTRDANRTMRRQLSSDMRNRGKGK